MPAFIPLFLLLTTAVVLAGFWKELVDWMRRAAEKVKQMIQSTIEGVKTFIVRMSDGVKNIAKYYSKNKLTNEYEETVTKKAVNENEVPEELRAKIRMRLDVEIDTTAELLAKLSA